MNYGHAKEVLLNPKDEPSEEDYREERIAHDVMIITLNENAERIANALTRIADKIEQRL